MRYILDTHALVWLFEDSRRLGPNARRILASPSSALHVPTIVLAELMYLSAKRRLQGTYNNIYDLLRSDRRVYIDGFDQDILSYMPPGLEMHDAIICATAISYVEGLLEEAAVITVDKAIRNSGVIPTVW